MAENTIRTRRYSQTVFELALKNNEIDKWLNDLQKLAVLAENSEYAAVMKNPRFTFGNKSKLLQKLFQDTGAKALNLAYILTKNGNIDLIKDIYIEYKRLVDAYKGITIADVTSAIPMDEKQKENLADKLGKLTGKKVIVSIKVDPKIIGGMIARLDGKIIDGSTGNQLSALNNALINAGS